MTAIRLSAGEILVLATHNPGKVAELEALLAPYGIVIVTVAAMGLPEPAETGTTFHENAALKAHAAAVASGRTALGDDSGMVVHGLDGAPGVYSADWASPGRDFAPAMRRVIDGLVTRFGSFTAADRRAEFVSVLCLATPDGRETFFDGRISGEIVKVPRGSGGFGYDPIFRPDGQPLTFGEMTPAHKLQLSHRARATATMLAALFPGAEAR